MHPLNKAAILRLNIARQTLKQSCPSLYCSYVHFNINQRQKRIK